MRFDVINHKITKFESNSQLSKNKITYKVRCCQSQNLKAIHNSKSRDIVKALVVINRKTTKFESNSQPTNE